MSHHLNNVNPCPLCEEKLAITHPDLSDWFRNKVKVTWPAAHISWSFRGKKDQEEAFIDGKTKLHFPNSAHNKSDDQGNPCAMALDLFEMDYNGIARWPWAFFRSISDMAAKSADPIFWGGHWTNLGDADHFQLVLNSSQTDIKESS